VPAETSGLAFSGVFETVEMESHPATVSLTQPTAGIHQIADVFIKVNETGGVDWVAPRRCQHAGGTLSLTSDCQATCPRHGWALDFNTMRYREMNTLHPCLESEIRRDSDTGALSVTYQAPRLQLRMPARLRTSFESAVSVRFLAHACIEVEIGGVRVISDPWLLGPAFFGSWWHTVIPPRDAMERLNNSDAVYISHNHSDHFHRETLTGLRRDKLIIVPKYIDSRFGDQVRALGFTRVFEAPFERLYAFPNGSSYFSIMKSGDGYCDSGLFLSDGKRTALLTVDSNRLNNMVLPASVDVLCSSFGGGASAFPACSDALSDERKITIGDNFRRATLDQVLDYVDVTNPRVFLPYASFANYHLSADRAVESITRRNSLDEARREINARAPAVLVVDPRLDDLITVSSTGVTKTPKHRAADDHLYDAGRLTTSAYQPWLDGEVAVTDDEVSCYFEESGFKDDLVIYIQPADTAFNPQQRRGYRIDFSGDRPQVTAHEAEDLKKRYETADLSQTRHVYLRIRWFILSHVIRERRPWDEIGYGYHMRFVRRPDIYESAFWIHFTNVHVR
jgi:CMP-N-acetylneuraminate monooxygenase